MGTSGSAGPSSAQESLRLANHYRQLTDEELIELAQQKETLTESAQEALATEFVSRKLTMPSLPRQTSDRPPPPPDSFSADDPYAEDRELVGIRTVWSESDARRLQAVLDAWGIPFYMGSEKATTVEDVTSPFAQGVPVGTMRVGVPWAMQALNNYFPQDERPEPKYEDTGDLAIRCPKCRSTEVVFEKLVEQAGGTGEKYRWKCDACGNEWEDDGVEK